jgi:hypothetical protein
MLIFASNRTAKIKTERQFAFDERGDAKMIHLSPRCILLTLLGLCPMVHVCLLMLPATHSAPTVANCSVSGRHRLDANGFTSRSLLVLSVTVAAMGFHVLQKMVVAMGGADEVHDRTCPRLYG